MIHEEQQSGWRIDKRIPVSMLFAILLQSAAVFGWAMTLENRIVILERTAITADQITGLRLDIASVKQDMAGVKQDLAGVKSDLHDISGRRK